MDKQVTSTPQYLEMGGGGGSGYLYLHYWSPVDMEPAINVDMVNSCKVSFKCNGSLKSVLSEKEIDTYTLSKRFR